MRALAVSAALVSALWSLATCGADLAAQPPSSAQTSQPAVLELHVNESRDGRLVIALRDAGGALWLRLADLQQLRLRTPSNEARVVGGERYYEVTALSGLTVTYVDARSEALLSAPASAFLGSQLQLGRTARPPLSAENPGAFVNYTVYGQRGEYAGGDTLSAYAEASVFGPGGTLTSDAVESTQDGRSRFVRLDSTASKDFVDSVTTLRLGDAISVAGAWSQPVRFGGIEFGSNYSIRPDLVTTPLLAVSGSAVVPSSVDVFVSGRAVGSTQVQPGPFSINAVPSLTGSGDVRLVIHDALGQEQVITVPFYSSSQLLQQGLTVYDFDVGALRENFGFASDDYGPLLASATWQHGFSPSTTVEFHGELLAGAARAAGVSVVQQLAALGVVTAGVARGGGPGGSGTYLALGAERITGPFSVFVRVEHAQAGFLDVGVAASPTPALRRRESAQLSWTINTWNRLSVAAVDEQEVSDQHERTLAASWSASAGRGTLDLSLSRTEGDNHTTSVYLVYTLPLGHGYTTSTSARHDSSYSPRPGALIQSLQKALPAGVGDGYLLTAGTDGSYQADWTHQAAAVTLDLGAARLGNVSAQRASASGAFIYLDDALYSARTVRDSFALVDLPGAPDVTVYFDNQPVAQTDVNGRAVVRDLRSYDTNRISVDPLQLPLDVALDSDHVLVVPAYRSGSVVRFPAGRQRAAVFRLHLRDGSPVPAGAIAYYREQQFPVGLDGMGFITSYVAGDRAEVRWDSRRCAFTFPRSTSSRVRDDFGDLLCSAD